MGKRADALTPNDGPGDMARATDRDWDRAASDITPADQSDDPAQIREDIQQTRAEMSGTIDALQEKLNPDRLKEQVSETVQEHIAAAKEQVSDAVHEQVDMVKEHIHDATIGRAERMASNFGDSARDTGSGVMETIKRNPVPAALAALGIGWLWMNRQNGASKAPSQYRYTSGAREGYAYGQNPPYGYGSNYTESAYRSDSLYPASDTYRGSGRGTGQGSDSDQSLTDRAGDVAGQAKEKVGDVAGQAQERVGQFADQAQEKVGQFTDQAQYGARQMQSRFDSTLRENPLALGAVVVAAGIAVGLSLPETPWEDQLMGEARDNVVQKAQGAAQETIEKVQQVAQQVQEPAKQAVQQMKETATQEAQKQGLVGGTQTPQGQPGPQGQQDRQPQQRGQGQQNLQSQPGQQGRPTANADATSGTAPQRNSQGTQTRLTNQ